MEVMQMSAFGMMVMVCGLVVACGSDQKPPSLPPFGGDGGDVISDASHDGQTLPDGGRDGEVVADAGPDSTVSGGPSADALGHVLIDATHERGLWLSPLAFDRPPEPNANYQGKKFTDHLLGRGLEVDLLTAADSGTITDEVLSRYEMVVRVSAELDPYRASELAAYERYVSHGGNLLLASDFMSAGQMDVLAARLGITIIGRTRGPQLVQPPPDEITEGTPGDVALPGFVAGSGVTAAPEGTRWIARLDADTFLDLNDDGTQSSNEPNAPHVAGLVAYGEGLVFFITDVNFLEVTTDPLSDRMLDELVPSNAPGM